MPKVIEARKALVECEKKLTEQVQRRSNRDRVKIKELQVEHAKLTNSLAVLLKDNREEAIDKKDDSSEVFRAEQEEKQKKKTLEFKRQKLQNEIDVKKELEELEKEQVEQKKKEAQRRKDLNLVPKQH